MDPNDARRVWRMLEPYHAIVYFAPESREAFANLGLKGFWMGYFASRAAAMGPVPAEVVIATFFNFHPRMVHKAIPDAWHLAAVEDILATRRQAAAAALRRVLGAELDSDDVAEAAALARHAAETADPVGRALFAGHAALAWPDEPELVLWHAATGAVPRHVMQSSRGYADGEWKAGEDALRGRGLLDDSGKLTDAGRAMRDRVEQRTDELMLPVVESLGDEDAARLVELVRPLSRHIVVNGGVPVPNPMGAPNPE